MQISSAGSSPCRLWALDPAQGRGGGGRGRKAGHCWALSPVLQHWPGLLLTCPKEGLGWSCSTLGIPLPNPKSHFPLYFYGFNHKPAQPGGRREQRSGCSLEKSGFVPAALLLSRENISCGILLCCRVASVVGTLGAEGWKVSGKGRQAGLGMEGAAGSSRDAAAPSFPPAQMQGMLLGMNSLDMAGPPSNPCPAGNPQARAGRAH